MDKYILDIRNCYELCQNCNKYEIYTNTSIYTLPKYLIIFFERAVDDKYIYNNIEYPDKLDSNKISINNNKKVKYSNYILDCVIEHYGDTHSGHYTSLCPIYMDNKFLFRFNDNYFVKYDKGYKSKNAIILLYKLIDN